MGKQQPVSFDDQRYAARIVWVQCDRGEMPHRKACAFYPHLPKMGTFYLGHKYI